MNNENLPMEKSELDLATVGKKNFIAGGIFHLIDRAFNGIALVYGDFNPAIKKTARMCGTGVENIERQWKLKRTYTESEAAIFLSFWKDFEKKYAKLQKGINSEMKKIESELNKCDKQKIKNMGKRIKQLEKLNRVSKKLGRGELNLQSNEQLQADFDERYSRVDALKIRYEGLKRRSIEWEYDFNYIFKALKHRYRKYPELCRKIKELQLDAELPVLQLA